MNGKVEEMLDEILRIEGSQYTNDPADSGGPTKYGVTSAVARAFGYTGDMEELTAGQAKDIYRKRYWIQPRFDQVSDVSTVIAEEMFDTGVNMGTSVAVKFLQRALNVLNNNGALFPELSVDGMIGAMSIAALKDYIKHRGQKGVDVLVNMLNAQQSVRYIEIAERRSKDERFQFGWQHHRVKIG